MSATILIVEDDLAIRENIGEILELENFTTLTAADGLQGIQLAREAQPDLILCDVTMPRLDGYSLLSKLRQTEETATIPLIFLTAKAETVDIQAGIGLGADNYLSKPFTKEMLLNAVTVCLEKYARLRQKFIAQQQEMRSLQQKMEQSQELAEVYLSLLKKFSQELRHPISNINVAIQLLKKNPHSALLASDLSVLENECIRGVCLLNEVANVQELLQASKMNVLRQLLPLQNTLVKSHH